MAAPESEKRRHTLDVPIQERKEVVELDLDNLPQNPAEITEFLERENSDAKYWTAIGMEYYARKQLDEAIEVLESGWKTAKDRDRDKRAKLRLLNKLAQLHLRKAKADAQRREEQLSYALRCINNADHLDPTNSENWISKGIILIAQKKPEDAMKQFQEVLTKHNPKNIPALIGKARVLFSKREFVAALQVYQEILRLAPRGEPDVRIGIGLCFHRMGNVDLAKHAFIRVLELNPSNSYGAALAAIIELNARKEEDDENHSLHREAFSKLLRAAYNAESTNALVSALLAEHYFDTGIHKKAEEFALNAQRLADNKSVASEAAYQLARLNHHAERWEQALQLYKACVHNNPVHLAGLFALGQVHIHFGAYAAAIPCFEKILSKSSNENSAEALVMLAHLYAKEPKTIDKAIHCFNQIKDVVFPKGARRPNLSNSVRDPGIFVEMSRVLETKDRPRALQALLLAEQLYKEAVVPVPADLLANLGALHHLEGDHASARTYYNQARMAAETSVGDESVLAKGWVLSPRPISPERRDAILTTISYNVARLLEDTNDVQGAKREYRALLQRHPAYTNAHLRLGIIAQQAGNLDSAGEHFAQALAIDKNRADAVILLSALQFQRGQIRSARKSYERVLQELEKEDGYALTALGNLYLHMSKNEKDRKLRESEYKKALEMYSYALRYDDRNIYAANGLAVVVAERGMHQEACEMFRKIRETGGSVFPVWMNLGHCLVELEKYSEAQLVYEYGGKKFDAENDPNVLLCLAKVNYILGKTQKATDHLVKALEGVEKVLEQRPDDRNTQYDLGLVLQAFAQNVSEKHEHDRSLELLEQAKEKLIRAKSIFAELTLAPKDRYIMYDRGVCEQRMKYCESIRVTIHRQIERAKEEEQLQQQPPLYAAGAPAAAATEQSSGTAEPGDQPSGTNDARFGDAPDVEMEDVEAEKATEPEGVPLSPMDVDDDEEVIVRSKRRRGSVTSAATNGGKKKLRIEDNSD